MTHYQTLETTRFLIDALKDEAKLQRKERNLQAIQLFFLFLVATGLTIVTGELVKWL